jgi:integrase
LTPDGRRRNKRQIGWVVEDTSTSPHTWKARWNDWSVLRTDAKGRTRPTQRSYILGHKAKGDLLTKGAAKAKWEKVRDSVMGAITSRPGAFTFKRFVEEHYLPERKQLRNWRSRSEEKFRYLMAKAYPAFGERLLSDIKGPELQRFLTNLAAEQKLCHDTVNGMRTYLRAIFTAAVDDEVIDKNPTRKLQMPFTRERARRFLGHEQIRQIDAALSGADKLAFELMAVCGLRAGEAFGLQWQDLLPNCSVAIRRTFSKGAVGKPKTKTSAKPVAIPQQLYQALLQLRSAALDQAPEAWMFPASKKRRGERYPISPENWRRRVLQPVAVKLGIATDLHSLRRSFATHALDNGANIKDIQEQLRHSTVQVTANIYVQPIRESVQATVQRVYEKFTEAQDVKTPLQLPEAEESTTGNC